MIAVSVLYIQKKESEKDYYGPGRGAENRTQTLWFRVTRADRYATPQYRQDAVINFCLFIKKSNKMAEFYVIFAACVFIFGTGGLESNQHLLG